MNKNLKIEYVSIDAVMPYEKNAKLHPQEQIQQIKNSIVEFGFDDPIAVWKDNVIIEGHGRFEAAKQLGYKEIPIIHLDELSDEQRRAYMVAHNKLTMNSDFDLDILSEILTDIENIDMSDFGFDVDIDISPEELDMSDLDDDTVKSSVIVAINCGNMYNYEAIKERLNSLAEEIQGSISVKMQ